MEKFDIPIVLLIFRRTDCVKKIIDVIRKISPEKVYILSDGGRNNTEWEQVYSCRKAAESAIDWPCEIIKKYANTNIGVYENIGLGAKWVFEREEKAIFLEDDNLPQESFFRFCKEMLNKYSNDNRIIWVCGTNYLGDFTNETNDSYFFTRHLLPCGWASWSDKFLAYYDFDLKKATDINLKKIRYSFEDKRLYRQQIQGIKREVFLRDSGKRYHSWDYHMAFSIRANNLLGISPSKNQIKNIGIDDISEHGFKKIDKHTMNLCGMDYYELPFPLKHPDCLMLDPNYEKQLCRKILLPINDRIKGMLILIIRHILRLKPDQTLRRKK